MILFPQPQKVSLGGEIIPKPSPSLQIDSLSPHFQKAISTLGFTQSEKSNIQILLAPNFIPKNGYKLSIASKGITLTATTEPALYHGLVTLRQILDQSSDKTIPTLEIEDWPDLPNRGYMLDISRCKVPTMQSLFSLIDLLASLKYNQLQLYTEHTFAYRNHKHVWQKASPLTDEEIQELDTYCYNRYIELVPNQNSFGHMERWLRHDAYKHLAECPNGFEHPISGWKQYGSTLKPTTESLDFVDKLYAELLPNFRSQTFNIGGDEPWELGQGHSKAQVEKHGKHRIYLDHLLALHQRVEAHGHHMQFWGDILLEEPELAKELPKNNLTALLWGYEADHPFPEQCTAMHAAGISFYVVPGTSTWNTIGGRLDNAFANIESAATNAIAHNANGLLLTDWGDNGHHQSSQLSIPSILYAAGKSWNCDQTKSASLENIAATLLPNFEYSTVIQLSNTARCFKTYLHNGTWLNKILFTQPNDFPELAKQLNAAELHQAQEELQTINTTGELELTRQLLLFAVRQGLALFNSKSVPPISSELLSSFSKHWLIHNRIGGLAESVGHFAES